MDLFERVSEDIKNAMKAKDKVALETLRNVKKFFLEAKTAPGANDTLTDADALKIMQKLVKQGKDSAAIYVQQWRQDLADVELAQVAVIEKYLPKQMSAEELEVELKVIIAQVGATGPKDMGKVMGIASKALAGKAEGRMISEVVKKLLNWRLEMENWKIKKNCFTFQFSIFSLSCCILINLIFNSQFPIFNYRLWLLLFVALLHSS